MTDLPAADLLHVRLERYPVPIGEWAERLNLPRRQVEQAVTELRRRGFPVCSDGRGVWLGDTVDLERTAASLHRRLVEQYVTLRAVRGTLQRTREAGVRQTTLPWAS